jgi:YgiT-type zinc finger domain-containing protein
MTLTKCARCGSAEVEERPVEKLIRAGSNVLALSVHAAVCRRCGERYFDRETVACFEESRKRLERGQLDGYRAVGALLRPAHS